MQVVIAATGLFPVIPLHLSKFHDDLWQILAASDNCKNSILLYFYTVKCCLMMAVRE